MRQDSARRPRAASAAAAGFGVLGEQQGAERLAQALVVASRLLAVGAVLGLGLGLGLGFPNPNLAVGAVGGEHPRPRTPTATATATATPTASRWVSVLDHREHLL